MRRTQPTTKKAKISSTTHVQMLQWLHGKQQQQLNNTDLIYILQEDKFSNKIHDLIRMP